LDMASIIREFERENELNDNQVADLITLELSRRELPPTDIARNTVWYWRMGKSTPNALLIEWLNDNAEDDRIKTLASKMLDAMRGNGNDK
jgi:hypothetical protein